MILFKEEQIKDQFWQLAPDLQSLICIIAAWAWKEGHEHTTITSLIRSPDEQKALFEQGIAPAPTSVHMYHRGCDIRKYKSPRLNQLDWVNAKYPYDPSRPELCTVVINENKNHHHLQVCQRFEEEEHD